jgi:hypothetical protein
MKTNRAAGNCWPSLLEGEYCADAWVQDQMQRKLTLERFHREVSGTDPRETIHTFPGVVTGEMSAKHPAYDMPQLCF